MLSICDAIVAAPWSRSHSKDRIVRLEFEGPAIVVRYEIEIGISVRPIARTMVRLMRRTGSRRGLKCAVLIGAPVSMQAFAAGGGQPAPTRHRLRELLCRATAGDRTTAEKHGASPLR